MLNRGYLYTYIISGPCHHFMEILAKLGESNSFPETTLKFFSRITACYRKLTAADFVPAFKYSLCLPSILTASHSGEEVLELYDNIQATIDNITRRDHHFIMGDLNSKLGNLHNTYPSVIGKHTIGNANSRGKRLANFCTSNQLVATTNKFQRETYVLKPRLMESQKNQIDFILTRKQSVCLQLLDSTALNVPDISDHRN